MPATLALSLPGPVSFGTFIPGIAREYTASTTATVISTAGSATLSVSDPGYLANGTFTLAQPLRVEMTPAASAPPSLQRAAAIIVEQAIGATDPLRTGTHQDADVRAGDDRALTSCAHGRPHARIGRRREEPSPSCATPWAKSGWTWRWSQTAPRMVPGQDAGRAARAGRRHPDARSSRRGARRAAETPGHGGSPRAGSRPPAVAKPPRSCSVRRPPMRSTATR